MIAPPRVRFGLSFAVLVALPVTAALTPACDIGDAYCPPNTVEEDRNDDCPYGPPGGPQRKNAERCEVAFDSAGCTVTFRDDVFPILNGSSAAPRSGGGCTLPGCHTEGSQGGARLLIPTGVDADGLYAALAASKNDAGDPYIAADNPNAWFLCNLEAKVGGGSAMPPTAGLTDSPDTNDDDTDRAVIEEWVRCGMKLDGAGTGGGGAGGGGTGGGAGGN